MSVKLVSSVAELVKFTALPSLTIVDFYATWCGPCKQIAPKIEELAVKKPNVNFLKVDVDQSRELAMKYKISAMPTFIAFQKGEQVDMFMGADFGKILQLVENYGESSKLKAITATDDELSAMSVKDLLGLAKEHYINVTGLPEKSDIVAEIAKFRN